MSSPGRQSEIARASDGLERSAASYAAMALSATDTPADARSALAELWQQDVQQAAVDLIGRLAAEAASDDTALS